MPSKSIAPSPRSPGSARQDSEDRGESDAENRLRHNQRARDNQRTSRARRKELLNDLRRRLDQYERRDVQATLDMQQAARRVAWENARLRVLLEQKGVPEAEVEWWLRQDSEAAGGSFALGIQPATTSGGTPMLKGLSAAPTSTYRSAPLLTPPLAGRHDFSKTSQRSGSVDESIASTSTASQLGTSETGPSLAERVTSCCTSATETSCEVAAAILANMQGDGDTNRARVALGCDDPSDCTVKNTRVLELLDEAG